MAAEDPLNAEALKQVLERLNEVLAEAAKLRTQVVRQLNEQRADQQQHVAASRKRTRSRKQKR